MGGLEMNSVKVHDFHDIQSSSHVVVVKNKKQLIGAPCTTIFSKGLEFAL